MPWFGGNNECDVRAVASTVLCLRSTLACAVVSDDLFIGVEIAPVNMYVGSSPWLLLVFFCFLPDMNVDHH